MADPSSLLIKPTDRRPYKMRIYDEIPHSHPATMLDFCHGLDRRIEILRQAFKRAEIPSTAHNVLGGLMLREGVFTILGRKFAKCIMEELDEFRKLFFGFFRNDVEEAAKSAAKTASSAAATDDKGKIKRSATERDKCLERDGRKCVLTGIKAPAACHIVPFAWNKSRANALKMFNLSGILYQLSDPEFGESVSTDLGLSSKPILGASDRPWNMISLTPTLHDWWSRAWWGFCPVEARPSKTDQDDGEQWEVVLHFRWTYRPPKGREPVMLGFEKDGAGNSQLDEFLEEVREWEKGSQNPNILESSKSLISIPLGHRSGNSHTLESDGSTIPNHAKAAAALRSGHQVIIKVGSKQDAQRFFRLMQIQWACIRLHSMTGAANRVPGQDGTGTVFGNPAYVDEQTRERIHSWCMSLSSEPPVSTAPSLQDLPSFVQDHNVPRSARSRGDKDSTL
ncbi:hypothetical protein B0I35DRAFT_514641 [Stachybotrys elegans]|uniref:HNH nuclease domain-containing protein n=1 Tax=Stachybotrys elegans TaxID=80388 RepID=A0A8K0SKX2_9HYPO|nr:hypothetical protein B0I35DRAFT_514641 [Stachybotrys elegans]